MVQFWRTDHGVSAFRGILVNAVFVIPILGFEENIGGLLAGIENKYGKAQQVWLMDRRIPTEEILGQMRRLRAGRGADASRPAAVSHQPRHGHRAGRPL